MQPPLDVFSVFSGIGGLDLGLQRAGMTIAAQVEIDPWCRSILARHWPEVPKHDDVRTCVQWWGDRPVPALVAGGFPCQPSSAAGLRLAQSDPRWLWPLMANVIAWFRPAWVVIENVPGLRTRGLADVLRDLAQLGYLSATGTISACAMGAPHPRERLFILAHPESPGRGTRRPHSSETPAPPSRPPGSRPNGRGWWALEPAMGRVAYGIPGRVDRLRGLGNAVVPQVAEHIGRLIMEVAA